MKKYLSILFILLFIGNTLKSQTIIGRISKSVGLITFEDKTKPGYGSTGTGTLLLKFTSKDSLRALLVTNKHVLPTFAQNKYIEFKIRNDSLKPNEFLDFAIQIFDEKGAYGINIAIDPEGNDLAVLDITNYFSTHAQDQHILVNALSTDFLATREKINENQIDLGNEILFVGYPSFLYDKRNISPIVRTGVISTFPNESFLISDLYRNNFYLKFREMLPEKLNGFLIDANAAGGSSGSLVITKPKFFRINKSGQMETYNDPNGQIFVLGILTDSFFDLDSRLTGVQRLNLGGVISAEQIIKTIDLLLSKFKP